ncbi:MAG: hypothetical protein JO156_15625 [Solirubrobacterales bacterium]|nr:hypothetical protein [Solirubrobacterales bacterium]
MEQRQAVAEHDRLDVDPVLVDEAVGSERAGEARSAEDDDVLAVFGVSASAELALAMALRHPDIYGAALCASPATAALRALQSRGLVNEYRTKIEAV